MNKIFKYSFLIIFLIYTNFTLSKEILKTPAPNFYLKDLQGNSHFLNDYCGEKNTSYKKNEKNVILISFFATWCLPCREEYPIFNQLQSRYRDKKVKIFLVRLCNIWIQYLHHERPGIPVNKHDLVTADKC